ncbi:7417_t:CDS:2 [Gigaspora margarita]|uniref:7417_t:CDS:1 n=1 Tax=Gigaspora margarita TaxID=4874 RepID=A0ABN7UH19_GIGMA|nr:7417_t:CDS:2 [Gigaspora margarita]
MSPKSNQTYTEVVNLQPDQHQVNLRVKVIAQIMFGEVEDDKVGEVKDGNVGEIEDGNETTLSKIKVAEFLVGDSSGCIIVKAINGIYQFIYIKNNISTKIEPFLSNSLLEQISLLEPQTCVMIHNARVEMYRGFMRIVVDQNTNAEIKPFGEASDDKVAHANGNDDIQPNLEKNRSLTEYQYVPQVVLNES